MLSQELRHSVRSLRRAPALAAISILTVGLGVGAGTSLFTVVKSVLLNPLPFPDADRLVWVASLDDARHERLVSRPDFNDWQTQTRVFTAMAAYTAAPILTAGGDSPERPTGSLVSRGFLDTLGVRPLLGRDFNEEDHSAAPLSRVILGYGLWQRAFGGRDLVGREIRVIGRASTVVGVMPPGFSFPEGAELWLSAHAIPDGAPRTAPNYWAIGRLRPGVTVEAAGRDLSAIAAGLKRQYPGPRQAADAVVVPLASHVAGSARTPLMILFAAVGVLLLIVCVNVTNLLLVRVAGRTRELAMRLALGASGSRLFRQLLVESLVLAAAGGALGCVLAAWSMDLVRLLLPAALPRVAEVRIDAGVLAFAVALSVGAGLLFGTLPAWLAGRLNIHDVLKSGARGQTAGRFARRAQSFLVVSEVALSMLLLAGAGLLLSSFLRLRNVDPGFHPEGVVAASVSSPVRPDTLGRIVPALRAVVERIRELPGVESAGVAKNLPLDPIERRGHFRIENQPQTVPPEAAYEIVGPGALETLRIPLLRGRRFTGADTAAAAPVAIVNEEMARRYWPGRDPIGERIWFESFEREHWLTIVGVAANVRQTGLAEAPQPIGYVCYPQVLVAAQVASTNIVWKLAPNTDPKTAIPRVRQALRESNPEAALSFRRLDDLMANATARHRFQFQVLAVFAVFAVVLAAVGLYGVLSYAVTSNRSVMGICMALGARPSDIFLAVASRGLGLTAAGASIGLAACVAMQSILAKLLYGVAATDPGILAAAAAVLLVTAFLACWFPARRASRLDPLVALREE